MKKSILKISLSATLLIALAACQTSQPALQGGLDTNFGDAIRHNTAAQAVLPTPAQKANTYIPADPARAAMARKKYQENTIEELENISASSASGG